MLGTLFHQLGLARRKAARHRADVSRSRHRACLRVEALEDRTVPALYGVTNLNDSGAASLRQAIIDANTAAGADDIQFSVNLQGTITLTTALDEIKHDVAIYGRTVAPPVGGGPGGPAVTVARSSAVGTPDFRIFMIKADKNCLISNLAITNGEVGMGDDGGGILNAGTLSISGCDIYLNHAGRNGGGIANTSTGALNVTECHIHENEADFHGGGIYFGGQTNSGICCTSQIYANHAGDCGGGLFNVSGSSLLIEGGSQIYGNSCVEDGGGIWNAGSLTMDSGLIEANSAGGGGGKGGGLFISMGVVEVRNNVSIQRNSASKGGGFYNSAGSATFDACTIKENEAAFGSCYAWQAGSTSNFINGCQLTGTIDED